MPGGRIVAIAIAWGIVGVLAALAVGVGVGMLGLTPSEYTVARYCFWATAIMLGGTGFFWALRTDQPTWWRITAEILIWIGVGVGLPECLRWLSHREQSSIAVADRVEEDLGLSMTCDTLPLPLAYRGEIWVLDTIMHAGLFKLGMSGNRKAMWPEPKAMGFGMSAQSRISVQNPHSGFLCF